MTAANWLTLAACLVTLLSVALSYGMSKQQIENAHDLALKQIQAAANETSRRLKAEVLLKYKQSWKPIPKNYGRSTKWKELVVNRTLLAVMKGRANSVELESFRVR